MGPEHAAQQMTSYAWLKSWTPEARCAEGGQVEKRTERAKQRNRSPGDRRQPSCFSNWPDATRLAGRLASICIAQSSDASVDNALGSWAIWQCREKYARPRWAQ